MSHDFNRKTLTVVVAQICQAIGWHSINSTPLDMLVDLLHRYLLKIGDNAHRYAEQCKFEHIFWFFILCMYSGWYPPSTTTWDFTLQVLTASQSHLKQVCGISVFFPSLLTLRCKSWYIFISALFSFTSTHSSVNIKESLIDFAIHTCKLSCQTLIANIIKMFCILLMAIWCWKDFF